MNAIEINTPCGPVLGSVRGGICLFQGIPYATCERFAEPKLTTVFNGIHDGRHCGTVCSQKSNKLAALTGDREVPDQNENILCLSVYAPENAEKLPVMVWVHGGSFLTGGSEEPRYSGARLVRTGNVIVVKISYRLGVLGFLYDPDNGIQNLGIKDQQTALEWIHNNISSFGGDPDRITVFGQSAGAYSVAALISLYNQNPYFSQALLQSAPLGSDFSKSRAIKATARFKALLGKDIREASIEEILNVQSQMTAHTVNLVFFPVIDDIDSVPKDCNIRVLAGYTDNDMSPFVQPVLGRLFKTKLGRCITAYMSDKIFIKATLRYVLSINAQGLTSDSYHISWHPQGNPLGACHCMELPFLLGEYEDWENATMLRGMTRAEFDKNSEVCLKVWTDFVNYGFFPDRNTPVI